MLRDTMIDAIGKTPLVRLRLDDRAQGAVYAKMELLNPFGMKDRVAKRSILEAKRAGILKSGAPIVESSSGTMALGVALVGTYLGHPVHIVTDPRIDGITLAKLQSLGYLDDLSFAQIWARSRLESRGYGPRRVEQALYQHPSVAEAAVYGTPDPIRGEAVQAVVRLKAGLPADPDSIRAFCRQRIAIFKTPETITFVDAIPKNTTGKILKRVLREDATHTQT